MSANDVQIGGSHYKDFGKFQPWDVLREWLTPEEYRGFMKGNALVYLAREKKKGGTVDIEKALHTLTKLVEVSKPNEYRTLPDPLPFTAPAQKVTRKYVRRKPTKAAPWGFKKNGQPYKCKPKGAK